ncbi:FecR domain-containing protein [Sphingobacterium hungaricum]|uniref:FecR protein domain-containing protein n=1 Tax=Sphingobacterium hungaricum TaxID=2082723 RepID=A0A928YQP1_9SPHI|nr:FecR family protein [Sphingobacterium hungaricum]MBE8714461.1 hypothetical protein [Sphingobacterium hungaricum]
MNKDQVEKFLSNKCTYDECLEMASYFEKDTEALDALALFEELGEEKLNFSLEADKEKFLNDLFPTDQPAKRKPWIPYLSYVAVLFILLFSYLTFSPNSTLKFINESHTFSNYSSTNKLFYFPDSSYVLLAPQSVVNYADDYAEKRIVNQLSGKGIYSVRKNQSNAFRVVSKGIETKAIGTVFTVNELSENSIQIKLLEGKIVVEDVERAKTGQIFLDTDHSLLINPKTFSYTIEGKQKSSSGKHWKFDQEESEILGVLSTVEWSNSEVKFLKIENQELFHVIETVFGIAVIAKDDSILHGNFTGSLYRGDDIETLIGNFCQLNNCSFQMNENMIEITKN